jgi:DNA-directed RNA polymerase specialized sigma subunit
VNQNLYKWLKNYKDLLEQIEYLEFDLETTELELKRWEGGNLSHVSLVKESKGSKVEEKIKQIKDELDIKRNTVNKLVELISKFEGLENKILKMKYVDGMTLERIGEELNYSAGHIEKKHAAIMRMIRFAD